MKPAAAKTPATPKDALLAAPVYPGGEIGLVPAGGVYAPVPVGGGAGIDVLADG